MNRFDHDVLRWASESGGVDDIEVMWGTEGSIIREMEGDHGDWTTASNETVSMVV